MQCDTHVAILYNLRVTPLHFVQSVLSILNDWPSAAGTMPRAQHRLRGVIRMCTPATRTPSFPSCHHLLAVIPLAPSFPLRRCSLAVVSLAIIPPMLLFSCLSLGGCWVISHSGQREVLP